MLIRLICNLNPQTAFTRLCDHALSIAIAREDEETEIQMAVLQQVLLHWSDRSRFPVPMLGPKIEMWTEGVAWPHRAGQSARPAAMPQREGP